MHDLQGEAEAIEFEKAKSGDLTAVLTTYGVVIEKREAHSSWRSAAKEATNCKKEILISEKNSLRAAKHQNKLSKELAEMSSLQITQSPTGQDCEYPDVILKLLWF